jgi:hypothetical protein
MAVDTDPMAAAPSHPVVPVGSLDKMINVLAARAHTLTSGTRSSCAPIRTNLALRKPPMPITKNGSNATRSSTRNPNDPSPMIN